MSMDKLPVVKGIISRTDEFKLDAYVKATGFSKSRLVGIAVFNELRRENPFEWDTTFPEDDDVVEYAYLDQAGRIMNFFKTQIRPIPLDFLLLIREDLGIPDRYEFLMGLKECLDKKMVIRSVSKKSKYYKDGTVLYGTKEQKTSNFKKVLKNANEYDKYKKLEKKFKDV